MTDIPTLGLPQEMAAIRNSDDLCLRWRALMGPLGFSRPRLWIAFLEPNSMMTAPLTQIEDIPRTADSRMCGSLLEMCRHVVGQNGAGGSVAMLLTRPVETPWTTQIAVGLAASSQRQTISVSRCGRCISRMTSSYGFSLLTILSLGLDGVSDWESRANDCRNEVSEHPRNPCS
jgi:hypothetical protein